MKLLFPVALGLVLASCSSIMPEPKPGTAAHQQWLRDQARENFLALKAQERKNRPAPAPTPEPERVAFRPFFKRKPQSTPAPSPQLAEFRARKPKPTPRLAEARPRQPDDTLYIWNTPRQQEPSTQRFTKGEIRYARELAKSPENLTSEERLWARRRYR